MECRMVLFPPAKAVLLIINKETWYRCLYHVIFYYNTQT